MTNNNFDLHDKVIVITGGGKSLGRFMAEFFSQRGAHIAICGRSEAHLKEIRDAIERQGGPASLIHPLDVTDPQAVTVFAEAVTKRFGRCDTLINNAPGWLNSIFLDANPAEINAVIDSIVKGPIFTCQAFWPLLKKAKPGHVVNITTLGARPMRSNASPIYVAAKYGSAGFTDALRRYAVHDGIRVVEILPGSLGRIRQILLRYPLPEFRPMTLLKPFCLPLLVVRTVWSKKSLFLPSLIGSRTIRDLSRLRINFNCILYDDGTAQTHSNSSDDPRLHALQPPMSLEI